MFFMQKEFKDLITEYLKDSRPDESKKELFHKLVNKLIEEAEEVRKEFNDKQKLTEELVDLVKFVISICLEFNISSDEFFEAFVKKSELNKERFLQTDWRTEWIVKDERNKNFENKLF